MYYPDIPEVTPKISKPKRRVRKRYGERINHKGLLHSPLNEQGVVYLFALIATDLHVEIEAVGTKFPDCEGKRKLPNGTYEKVEIEFEHKSKHYKNDHPLDWNGILVC